MYNNGEILFIKYLKNKNIFLSGSTAQPGAINQRQETGSQERGARIREPGSGVRRHELRAEKPGIRNQIQGARNHRSQGQMTGAGKPEPEAKDPRSRSQELGA